MARIPMKAVRLSFPSLFHHGSFGGQSTDKYEATFILDKKEHANIIKQIESAIKDITKETFKGKQLPDDKICLKDGDDMERTEYAGKMTVKASTKKRPMTLDVDKTPVAEEDNLFYGGCYVNAIITLWAQDNQFGKRINAQLDGVQFYKDGEAFGDAGVGADAFDTFGDDEDETF